MFIKVLQKGFVIFKCFFQVLQVLLIYIYGSSPRGEEVLVSAALQSLRRATTSEWGLTVDVTPQASGGPQSEGSTKLTLWFTVCQSKFSGASVGIHKRLYVTTSPPHPGSPGLKQRSLRKPQYSDATPLLFRLPEVELPVEAMAQATVRFHEGRPLPRQGIPHDVGDFDNAGVYPWRGHDETLPDLVTV
ncbi:hypothetical protein HPB51_024919 [Rhipicephalus microplus]|uniref:Uncharacterized protein n=1 Tax=Rhipicephalus microplus TaxID=6941 RepID=A0A9J6DXT0_RHIMP|nr:hypothetical protein HPB51_024919 [Rhipicephalus microplus]